MHPIHVIVQHDFLDYAAAIGGILGGVAALIALGFAWLSKRDAGRSATAAQRTKELADEQVTIMRGEAAAALAERADDVPRQQFSSGPCAERGESC